MWDAGKCQSHRLRSNSSFVDGESDNWLSSQILAGSVSAKLLFSWSPDYNLSLGSSRCFLHSSRFPKPLASSSNAFYKPQEPPESSKIWPISQLPRIPGLWKQLMFIEQILFPNWWLTSVFDVLLDEHLTIANHHLSLDLSWCQWHWWWLLWLFR